MRTIANTQSVTLNVTKADTINGEWIPLQRVSALLLEKENADNTAYKALRTRFYNSTSGNKYNMESFAGVKCINIKQPMKDGVSASLVIDFKVA